jgi:hypothetical protein
VQGETWQLQILPLTNWHLWSILLPKQFAAKLQNLTYTGDDSELKPKGTTIFPMVYVKVEISLKFGDENLTNGLFLNSA